MTKVDKPYYVLKARTDGCRGFDMGGPVDGTAFETFGEAAAAAARWTEIAGTKYYIYKYVGLVTPETTITAKVELVAGTYDR